MKIVTVRRISQVLFFVMFVWFGVVATFGTQWNQLRGWPVNWFLQLDPLVGLGTMLTTHTLYWPLLWTLATVVLTIIVGRFFCSWLCPFGTMHHFVSWLALSGKSAADKIRLNQYHRAQGIKYVILIAMLLIAAIPTARTFSLQTGLLDPIPLVTRSLNLVLLPIADGFGNTIFVAQRFYDGAWLVGAIFFAALALNLAIPRFYCRFVCPLGALFGILDRFALWRIGRNAGKCTSCKLCEKHCHGACQPSAAIRIPECVLCFNCLDECKHDTVRYQTAISAGGEVVNPDISRRGLMLTGIGGLLALPMIRLANKVGANWDHRQVRPPGSLAEEEFLKRCLKCGQCMRICPTNVLQPAGIESGIEAMWTPVFNNRIGSSGCQLNCVACGYVCPTAAIRPITLSEKLGVNEFADKGPVKMGTAFVDQSRCLPWSMDKPCIVCQENCPVSPKAIYTREYYRTIRMGRLKITHAGTTTLNFEEKVFKDGLVGTGDYYCRLEGQPDNQRRKIVANTADSVTIAPENPWNEVAPAGTVALIEVRLQRPYVDIEACTGCGVCEHECPVSGLRAVRVTAEGETRSQQRRLLLRS